MFTKLLITLGLKAKQNNQPLALETIIDDFNSKVIQLEERITFDEKEVEKKTLQQTKLEEDKIVLNARISRANKIRTKFKDLVA